MRTDKAKAIKLRRQGKSYSEIQRALGGVSKSTLSIWLGSIVLSENAWRRLEKRTHEKSIAGLIKRNKMQTQNAIETAKEIQSNAANEVKDLSPLNLFFTGIVLYWAEGYKRPIVRNGREVTYHPIGLTNSDPKLIKIFLKFLIKICGVPVSKIKADVRIFKHLNEQTVLNYWIKEIGVPKENFTKTFVGVSKSSMNKRPFNRLPYGVIQVRVSDTRLFHKIIGWINGIKNKI